MPETARCSSVALIAEDEWLVRMDIADALLNAGWQVIEAATGEQALTLADGARANGVGVVDLLVTDIRLGGAMNGWDLAEALRLKRPDIAVVYASATPAAETRQVAGSAFVEKPFRIDTLMRICSRLTGHGAPC
jgi:CheY-like chemotaxis protein